MLFIGIINNKIDIKYCIYKCVLDEVYTLKTIIEFEKLKNKTIPPGT